MSSSLFVRGLVSSGGISFGLHTVLFLVAFSLETDKVTDLTYSLSLVSIALQCWLGRSSGAWSSHQQTWGQFIESLSTDRGALVSMMIVVWGIRLGTYLVTRVWVLGRDERFDKVRGHFARFASFWGISAAAVWILALPVVIANAVEESSHRGSNVAFTTPMDYVAMILFGVGFMIETASDTQKFLFKLANPQDFFYGGLFRYCRHPNYLGEILVWFGIGLFALPAAGSPWNHPLQFALVLVSPLTITTLLLVFSGVPPLERKWRKKYGDRPEFQAYLSATGTLFPRSLRGFDPSHSTSKLQKKKSE